MAVTPKEPTKLAHASVGFGDISIFGSGNFYMPTGNTIDGINQSFGLSPEKLMIPHNYHAIIQMCYDFYQRGGMAAVVVNRLAELSITKIRNGQRKTSDEANTYYDAVLHRAPSRLTRFINSMAIEYFLSGMVLPKVQWEELSGAEISPDLIKGKTYFMPRFDWYPPQLVHVIWAGWGDKEYWLKLPPSDIRLIKNKGGKIKAQQMRYEMMLTTYPSFVSAIEAGANEVQILDTDPILRKQLSITPYPTPFMMNVLETLVFKQQLRRMDYSVASRVINAILLIQEGDKDFPLVEGDDGNLVELKRQIQGRQNNPVLQERLFELFSNHTTKLTWITPDVDAMLNQEKYQQANEEMSEGLGFSRLLITGESRNSQASELSTYAIQPQMEELRMMIMEWAQPIYEKAAELNKFRNIPQIAFTPVKLQDAIKTAAIFAQAFKEGNISRTTRDDQFGIDFLTETELMQDEKDMMDKLPKKFPDMPYNTQVVPGVGALGNGLGRPPNAASKGGRPTGSTNVPVNNRRSGVKPSGQSPTSRVKVSEALAENELMDDEDLMDLFNKVADEYNIQISIDDIL